MWHFEWFRYNLFWYSSSGNSGVVDVFTAKGQVPYFSVDEVSLLANSPSPSLTVLENNFNMILLSKSKRNHALISLMILHINAFIKLQVYIQEEISQRIS